tara:strand:+ start:3067 stop:3420 length:354 start_codon:yes stop_codon:yes gene_type:complete
MFNDPEIQNWIDEHGLATSMNFIVYGDMVQEEADLLVKGVIIQLANNDLNNNFAVFYDPIDEKQARAWDTFQGTSLTFVFAGTIEDDQMIIEIIQDGLRYLRYKYDYLGHKLSGSYV